MGRREHVKQISSAPTAPGCTSTPLPLKRTARSASTSTAETSLRFWYRTHSCALVACTD
jgi:hypothetical protein